MYLTTGGSSAGLFDRCVFDGNTSAKYGGAFSMRDAGKTAAGGDAVVVRNSLFTGNHSGDTGGGAMYLIKSDPMRVENCTFDGNTTTGVGTDLYIRWTGSLVRNSIFNTPNFDTSSSFPNAALAMNCLNSETLPSRVLAANGNFADDPEFADAANGDYSLRPSSPCRNTASVQDWMASSTDLAGRARILGDGPDLGAYELWIEPGTVFKFR